MIKFYMEDAGEALKETGSTLHGLESGEAEIRLEKTVPISWRNRSGSLCFCALQSSLRTR